MFFCFINITFHENEKVFPDPIHKNKQTKNTQVILEAYILKRCFDIFCTGSKFS